MSKREEFVELAESLCGTKGSKYQPAMGQNGNDPWSASFVSYCSKKTGLSKTTIPVTSKPQDIVTENVVNKGTWVSGPAEGNNGIPETGDVLLFSWDTDGSHRADQAGIVKSYDQYEDKIIVILADQYQGDHSTSDVSMITLDSSYGCIKGYFRPNWEAIDGSNS